MYVNKLVLILAWKNQFMIATARFKYAANVNHTMYGTFNTKAVLDIFL